MPGVNYYAGCRVMPLSLLERSDDGLMRQVDPA
jgi:hypothetical protein